MTIAFVLLTVFSLFILWHIVHTRTKVADEQNVEQGRLYQRWKEQLEGEPSANLDRIPEYIDICIRTRIQRFIRNNDVQELQKCAARLRPWYDSSEGIRLLICRWIPHAHLYIGDYEGAWTTMKASRFCDNQLVSHAFNMSLVLFLSSINETTDIDGHALVTLLEPNTGITDIGERYQEEIEKVSTEFLKHFHTTHGKNLIHYLYTLFDTVKDSEWAYGSKGTINTVLFRGSKGSWVSESTYPKPKIMSYPSIPLVIEEALRSILRTVLREAENLVREENGLPKVGQGWIGETMLYKLLCKSFPNEQVIQHAHLPWLGQQHLDIYFPNRRVGVEYQGLQHEQPVDFWGGQEAFVRQQERDRRKKRLCETHGCKLIYTYPLYDINDLECQIRESSAETLSKSNPDIPRNPPNKVRQRISITIPPGELPRKPIERLRALAKKRERSVSYLVIEAVLQYLNQEEAKDG